VLLKDCWDRIKDLWELHAAHRPVFEIHCSTSNTNPASYNAKTLAMIKPRKLQRIADPMLQSGVVSRNYFSNAIARAMVYLKLSSGSGSFWFLICAPAPTKPPSSGSGLRLPSPAYNRTAVIAISQQPRTLQVAVLCNMIAALTYSMTEQMFALFGHVCNIFEMQKFCVNGEKQLKGKPCKLSMWQTNIKSWNI